MMTPPSDPYSSPDEQPGGMPASGESASYGASGPYGEPPNPAPSRSIQAAVRLMYVGAGLSLLWTLLLIPQRQAMVDEIASQDVGEVDPESVAAAAHTVLIIIGLLTVALWIWMAHANQRGQGWARIVATVLGGLAILVSLFSLFGAFLGADAISILLNLALISLAGAILFLLFRPDSSAFYNAVSPRPRY